jgi:hypothetical protein
VPASDDLVARLLRPDPTAGPVADERVPPPRGGPRSTTPPAAPSMNDVLRAAVHRALERPGQRQQIDIEGI